MNVFVLCSQTGVEIDRQKIGLGVLAFVRLDADRNNGDVTRELEGAIRKIPEVVASSALPLAQLDHARPKQAPAQPRLARS